MNLVKPALLAVSLFAVAPVASAANASASFGVQLTVQNLCTISANSAATALNFGTVIGNITSNIDTPSTDLTINCNGGVPYQVGLNDGNNVSTGQRRMRLGTTANYVNYNLYSDSGRTAPFGATTATDVDGTGNGLDRTITVYGRVLSGQSVPAGVYSDTVLATIEY